MAEANGSRPHWQQYTLGLLSLLAVLVAYQYQQQRQEARQEAAILRRAYSELERRVDALEYHLGVQRARQWQGFPELR